MVYASVGGGHVPLEACERCLSILVEVVNHAGSMPHPGSDSHALFVVLHVGVAIALDLCESCGHRLVPTIFTTIPKKRYNPR